MVPLRVGLGDRYDPSASPTTVERWGRSIFWSRVEEIAPEVLRSLGEILPLYCARYGPDDRPAWTSPAEPSDENDPLEAALLTWADRHGLRVAWALDTAVRTLRLYHPEAVARRRRARLDAGTDPGEGNMHFVTPGGPGTGPLPSWRPDLVGWHPLAMAWADFEKAVREDFERALTAHREEVERAAREAEYEPTPQKYGTAEINYEAGMIQGTAHCHFDMLVRRRVQGWSVEKIRKHYRLQSGPRAGDARAARTVREAIRKTATLIGLPE